MFPLFESKIDDDLIGVQVEDFLFEFIDVVVRVVADLFFKRLDVLTDEVVTLLFVDFDADFLSGFGDDFGDFDLVCEDVEDDL